MSYCRFSSNDFDCDLYVYADVGGGITTHVAGIRFESDTERPRLPDLRSDTIPEYLLRNKELTEWIKNARRVKIELPYAGTSFYNQHKELALENLRTLKELGYHMPDWLITAIEEDFNDEDEPE